MNRMKAAAAALISVLGVTYAAGVYYFRDHTFPNTTVDGQAASMVEDETAMSLVRNTAVTEDVTFRIQDQSWTVPSAQILHVADEDAVRRVITGRNAYAWPAEYFKIHDLSSGRAMACDRAALKAFFDEKGVTSTDIPAVDAVLSDFIPGGDGYVVIPDSDGWKADPDTMTEFAALAAEQEVRDIDLTEEFKVKAAVLADDAALHAEADHLNKLVNHDFTISVGDDTRVLNGETLNGWLKESRDGILGLDAEQIWAYTDGLQAAYQEFLDVKGAENGQRYIIDTESFNNILAKKLDLVMPVAETESEAYSRKQKNQNAMDKARRQARKLKDQAEADKLIADAEASLVLAPDLVAILREDIPATASDASAVDKTAAGAAAAKKILKDQEAAEKAAKEKAEEEEQALQEAVEKAADADEALAKAQEKKAAADQKLADNPESNSAKNSAEKAAAALEEAEKTAASAHRVLEDLTSRKGQPEADGISRVLLMNGMYIENPLSVEAQEVRKAEAEAKAAEEAKKAAEEAKKKAKEAEAAGATPSDATPADAEPAEPAEPAPEPIREEMVEVADDMIYLPLLEADPGFVLGYGLNYVEVDIPNQHVTLYENARKIMESSCVTGLPTAARRTHEGVFKIDYKQRNRILRGSQRLYASFVNYWMPFDGGIGLHDATWRGSFGGTIYKYSGSHGCVNLPLSFAKRLYARVYPGMTVWVH